MKHVNISRVEDALDIAQYSCMHGHLKPWAEMDILTPVLSLKYIAKDHPCKKSLKGQEHCSINRTSFMDSNLFHDINTLDRFIILFSFQYSVMRGLFCH